MHELLRHLPPHARVLDLGCRTGSFAAESCPAVIVRADLEPPASERLTNPVCCDGRQLPFCDACFDVVILNHSLEHIPEPAAALAEIGRVVRRGGALYIAVPDASTITDKIYRWLGRGGGHVNPFTDVDELVSLIVRQTGLPHVATRLLFTSLSFLNRRNVQRVPRRLYLLGGGFEWTLRLGTLLFRKLDRLLGTRLAIYGWACWFGAAAGIDPLPWTNVCVRCGSGEPSAGLAVRRNMLGLRVYRCPACGTTNYFTDDPAE